MEPKAPLQKLASTPSNTLNRSITPPITLWEPTSKELECLSLHDFDLLKAIGRGSFGIVKLAKHKTSGNVVAIKCVSKKRIAALRHSHHLIREQKVHKSIHHPCIARLYATFQDQARVYLCIEYLPGGELYNLLTLPSSFVQRNEFGGLQIQAACFYFACLVSSIQYLHNEGILYRDIKAENLVLDKSGYAKLLDFGFAKYKEQQNKTLCGSLTYMAPEILSRSGHDERADLWSCGILLYEMLIGSAPFDDANNRELGRKITSEDVPFPPAFACVYPEAFDLISKLLVKDPSHRMQSISDVKQHPLMTLYFPTEKSWEMLERRQITPPFIPKVPSHNNVSFGCSDSGDDSDGTESCVDNNDDIFEEY